VAFVEVVEQSGLCRLPAQQLAGQHAGGGAVGRKQGPEPPEVRACVGGSDGDHRYAEMPADDLGDVADAHALIRDRVQSRARRSLPQREAEEVRGIESVDGRPTVRPVAAALEAAGAVLEERREFARRRQAVIAANADLRERELIKLASLASALSDALCRRDVNSRAAGLAAEAGIAVFRIAFETWMDDGEQRQLPQLIRVSLDELKAVTAGR